MASAPLALSVTAFDFTTSKITVPNHGQATGTGPCAIMNVGGVLPRGPGFAPVTDYFVINVDTNTLQLASSSSNAFAATPITFTDNGTGTSTLLIGVPYRRPRTHVATVFNGDGSVQTPGTQIFSADLNANYDAWAAAFALWTGQPQSLIDSPTLAGNLTVGGALLPFADFTFTATGGGSAVLTANNHPLHTGAGPIRGSSSTTLPSGFPAATDVFAIKLSANTFSIATSQANALAGAAIAMADAGTGTHTINHQATTARISDVTATRNMSAIAYKTASPRTHVYPGSAFLINAGSPTRSGNVWTFSTSVVAELICPIWYAPGTVISSLVWSFNRNSNNVSGEFDFKLIKRSFGDGGVTTSNVYSDVASSGTGFTTRDTVSFAAPYTFEAGFMYHLSIATAAMTFSGAPAFDGVTVAVDRL